MTARYITDHQGRGRVRLRPADTFMRRLRGLLFTRALPEGEGLLLTPCRSVHMIGMLYALDIVYLDCGGRICKIVPHLRPFFGVSACRRAAMALEVAAGTAAKYGWQPGEQLLFDHGEE